MNRPDFNPNIWYDSLFTIAAQEPEQRYRSLVGLHTQTYREYTDALARMTNQQAEEISSDGRPRKLVVAHIMGWEEWQLQVFNDGNRMRRLRQQMELRGFYDFATRQVLDFQNVDEFNAFQAGKYQDWTWDKIRDRAVQSATQLRSHFPAQPPVGWVNFLNHTPEHNWKVLPNQELAIPAGWYLWMVSLEHTAVEHRADLMI